MKIRSLVLLLLLVIGFTHCQAQPLHGKRTFTRQDTLRGTNTPERQWWDVQQYQLFVSVDPDTKTIRGYNDITFSFTLPMTGKKMQLDLQQPMDIEKITFPGTNHSSIPFTREGNVYWVDFTDISFATTDPDLKAEQVIRVHYKGKPREAKMPPWDGGWIWKKDEKGRPFLSVAVQGMGASAWYPCKDFQGDEPEDGAGISVEVPEGLIAVANGKQTAATVTKGGRSTFSWAVKNPINNYNIVPYIGHYVNWETTYAGEKGPLTCSYWVLDYNLEKSKKQFTQVEQTLKALEHWFGPYPFYEDSYKLVEAPHLGMEHQSAVAYGNKYMNGYLGQDLSGSGWGKKWDYIIVHETGHEWFGNNLTTKDLADMWVHEGFTDYCEPLFVEYHYGKEAGDAYLQGLRRNIQNDQPIIGPYGVNQEGSGDMYAKGANLLHTIRQVITNDTLFRNILRGLNKDFYHQTVTTRQVEEYISRKSGRDFSKVFDQYLRTIDIPVLEVRQQNGTVSYRWTKVVPSFDLPVRLTNGQWLQPTPEWKNYSGPAANLEVDKNFYVRVSK